jgi:hypothetical protein
VATKLTVEIDEGTLRKLVIDHLNDIFNVRLSADDIKIETKSAQNYKAEWEVANYRARVDKTVKQGD